MSKNATARIKAVHEVTRPRELSALTSPVRQEIVDALGATGSATIGTIARVLGRDPHGLYYHVRNLVRVGLVAIAGEQPSGRRMETLYCLPAIRLRVRYDLASRAFRSNMQRTAAAMLRLTLRDFRRGLLCRDALCEAGPKLNLWVGRVKGRLTEAELGRANRLIRELFDLLSAHPGRDRGRLHAVTLAIVPFDGR